MRELIARVRALLRRAKRVTTAEEPEILQSGNLTLFVAEHRVELDGKELSLTPREFSLLKVFMLNKGKVLSREQLLRLAWGVEEFIDKHTVDVHWLREKIEPDPRNPRRIVTVRGVGYRFVE